MSATYYKIVWLRGLIFELGFPPNDLTPLHGDNTSAIQIAANPVYHERTKHIEVIVITLGRLLLKVLSLFLILILIFK